MIGSMNVDKTSLINQIFAKEDLDAFLASLLTRASTAPPEAGFEPILKAARRLRTSLVDALDLIRQGKIADIRISPDHEGILSLMVRKQDRLQRPTDNDPFVGWFANAEIAYYVTPDFKLEVHGGLSHTDWMSNYTNRTVNVGLGAEYKFEDTPFSVFGTYDFFRSDFTTDNGLLMEQQRVLFGVKFNLDDGTLKDNDREGVKLSPVHWSQAFGPIV